MKAALIATGVAVIPVGLFGLGMLAMVDAGKRRQALLHPIRTLVDALNAND